MTNINDFGTTVLKMPLMEGGISSQWKDTAKIEAKQGKRQYEVPPNFI